MASSTLTLADASSPALREAFARHPVPAQAGAALQGILLGVLDRAADVTPEHASMWTEFLALLEQNRADPRSVARCAVLANLVAVVALDEPSDYAATAELASALGARRLARLQHRAGVALEKDPALRWSTAAVRLLLDQHLPARLAASPHTAAEARQVAERCALVARTLVLEGLDPDRSTTPLATLQDLHDLADHGSLQDWRDHLGMVAASPWGPYADRVLALAGDSDRPDVLPAVEASIELCREWCRDRERDQVAREIRHLVALSGVSQREFAGRIGTSPSRLSTYVRGTVTPSAAMLLRIQRVSRGLQGATPRAAVESRH